MCVLMCVCVSVFLCVCVCVCVCVIEILTFNCLCLDACRLQKQAIASLCQQKDTESPIFQEVT